MMDIERVKWALLKNTESSSWCVVWHKVQVCLQSLEDWGCITPEQHKWVRNELFEVSELYGHGPVVDKAAIKELSDATIRPLDISVGR